MVDLPTCVCDNLPQMAASEAQIRKMLAGAGAIAVIGASPNPSRPSNTVMSYLIGCGYQVIPVRPRVSEILGQPCYGSLAEIPGDIDIVVVFRNARACPAVARDAAAIKARSLWLQEGIVSDEAAAIAEGAGLDVVMDRCIKVAHRELLL